MATMVQQVCWCGKRFEARAADVKRGWGKACCKKHAARARELKGRCAKDTVVIRNGRRYEPEPDYMRHARTIDEGMLGLDFDWSPL